MVFVNDVSKKEINSHKSILSSILVDSINDIESKFYNYILFGEFIYLEKKRFIATIYSLMST